MYYERVGPADVRGLLQRIPVKDMLHYHAYKTEEAIQLYVVPYYLVRSYLLIYPSCLKDGETIRGAWQKD